MQTSRFVGIAGFLSVLWAASYGNPSEALAQTDSVPQASAAAQAFEASVNRLRAENKARAVIAGLWTGNDPGITIAVGESMTGVPADTAMTVRIGGISQLFLGTLLMRLAEQGQLGLDDKISKYLPDLLAADEVTVRMLAQNTAGYKDYVRDEKFIDLVIADPFRNFSSDEIIDYATSDG